MDQLIKNAQLVRGEKWRDIELDQYFNNRGNIKEYTRVHCPECDHSERHEVNPNGEYQCRWCLTVNYKED